MNEQLLLVGSIPLDTPQDVFETFGAPLGRFLNAVPDGEVGPRSHWISRIHYQVFAGHPELDILAHPRPDNGVERLNPHDNSDRWQFKVRDGVERVRFGDPGWRLGYARDAVNSYFVFRTLKEKGVLPRHLRFQVSMPMVNSALPPRVFPVEGDLDKIKPGFEAALRAELAKIVEKIPAEELAIQWDCATEVQDAYGAIPQLPRESMIERNVAQVRNLSPGIPEERRARLSPLFRHAGRLAALSAGDAERNREDLRTPSWRRRAGGWTGSTSRCWTPRTRLSSRR